MAHLFIPNPYEEQLPVFFNVDAPVGAYPAANNREDVLLVQFAMTVIANNPVHTTHPDFLAAAKQVKTTGFIDQPTINAIRQMQLKNSMPGAIADGRVSPAKGGASYGESTYSIAILMNSLQNRNVDIWPRIDKIPGCPAELAAMVKRTVAGI
ncbi:MAG: hypothetical protein JNK48_20435 [Bryobacterales bacterium]|nr:hypothetical protein [Bryobacterales bacterium]